MVYNLLEKRLEMKNRDTTTLDNIDMDLDFIYIFQIFIQFHMFSYNIHNIFLNQRIDRSNRTRIQFLVDIFCYVLFTSWSNYELFGPSLFKNWKINLQKIWMKNYLKEIFKMKKEIVFFMQKLVFL
jgi:hypothetical protein